MRTRRPRSQPQPPTPSTRHLTPDYVAIGHLTLDRLAGGSRAGGSVAYASRTATCLGLTAGIVTVADEELDWPRQLPGVKIARWPSPATTAFENVYEDGGRTQRILAVAEAVPADAVPIEWRNSAIVHLAPVDHEVSGAFPGLFPGSLIGLTPQGLLREWSREGRVRQGRWSGDDALLAGSHVAVFSEEDLAGDPDFLSLCLDRVPVTILTRGARGATLFIGGRARRFPAIRASEVDPTGAGDVFAAAFLIEYHGTKDPYRSTAFACSAASFAVEQVGLAGIPNREAVEDRLRQVGSGRNVWRD